MEEQYIVSARKYRPMTFDSVVGQRALTTTLKNAILSGRLAHAYLFCGPRGVGKTTCARIFAKTINCEHLTPEGDPCGECESCKAFDEGRSLCIHELDAASNNSVDDIRELIEQVRIPPQSGKYKVFIIDEVHMLSQQAFNAFLKTLEEPPRYVVFILATTEKHKILPTILSRCQVYDFARITVQSIVDHLKYVAEKEGYKAEEDALGLIAQKADGGMRDALSLFDQIVSFTQGNVTYEATVANLNMVDVEYYFRLTDSLLEKNIESSLLLLDEVLQKGFDGGNFINGYASHLRNLLVARDARTLPLLELSENLRKRCHEQALRCRPQFIFRALRLANDCDQAYRTSRNKRLQVELCLIEMAQESDEDGDGAGLGPAKILKPIFSNGAASGNQPTTAPKKPQTQTQKSEPRVVATAKTPESVPAKTPEKEKKPKLGKIDLNAISIGVKKPLSQNPSPETAGTSKPNSEVTLEQQEKSQTQVMKPGGASVHDYEEKNQKPLSEDELRIAWQHFANSLPEKEKATAERMRAVTPHVIGDNKFRVTVGNPFVQKALNMMRNNILIFIDTELKREEVEMEIEVENIENAVLTFSKPELFNQMLKDFSSFDKLHEFFGLELN